MNLIICSFFRIFCPFCLLSAHIFSYFGQKPGFLPCFFDSMSVCSHHTLHTVLQEFVCCTDCLVGTITDKDVWADSFIYIVISNFGKYCLLFNENDFVVRQTVCRVCYSIIGIILPVSLLNSLVDSVENIIILKLHNLAKFHEIQL